MGLKPRYRREARVSLGRGRGGCGGKYRTQFPKDSSEAGHWHLLLSGRASSQAAAYWWEGLQGSQGKLLPSLARSASPPGHHGICSSWSQVQWCSRICIADQMCSLIALPIPRPPTPCWHLCQEGTIPSLRVLTLNRRDGDETGRGAQTTGVQKHEDLERSLNVFLPWVKRGR